jgi:hypothetical protein
MLMPGVLKRLHCNMKQVQAGNLTITEMISKNPQLPALQLNHKQQLGLKPQAVAKRQMLGLVLRLKLKPQAAAAGKVMRQMQK